MNPPKQMLASLGEACTNFWKPIMNLMQNFRFYKWARFYVVFMAKLKFKNKQKKSLNRMRQGR